MEDHILIRYGELSLKKTNRRQFVQKVTNTIKRALKDYENLEFESRGMRFYIHLNNIYSPQYQPNLTSNTTRQCCVPRW